MTSYHYSDVKVRFFERAGFYHRPPSLSRLLRDYFADVFGHRHVRWDLLALSCPDAGRLSLQLSGSSRCRARSSLFHSARRLYAFSFPCQEEIRSILENRLFDPISDKYLSQGFESRRPSGLRKTTITLNSLAHRTTWLRSDLIILVS